MKEITVGRLYPRISICMATYNGAKFLREQLQTLAAQTLLPMELVVSDDGSSDDTVAIISEFAATSPFPVRCFHNAERLGSADNFIYAASLCEGELISFCDQDDLWASNKLERCAKEFQNPGILLCVHSGSLFGDGVPPGKRVPDYPRRQVFPRMGCYPLNGALGFAMVLHRELLSITDGLNRPVMMKYTGHNCPLPHDHWFWFLAICFGEVAVLPEALVHYRQHANNASGASVPSVQAGLRKVLERREYARRADDENQAAELLEGLINVAPARWRSSAFVAAQSFRRYARISAFRASIYQVDAAFLTRLGRFLRLISEGGYGIGDESAQLGRRAMLKDLVAGVLRPHQRQRNSLSSPTRAE